jgi:hypothetical protein
MALLAANPAVRELLIRPLAIRQASLVRYTGARGGSAAAGRPKHTLPAAPAAAMVATQVVVASAGLPGAEDDLSGDALNSSELEQEASKGQLGGMQRMASTVVGAVQDTSSL